jgi:hypothetical protein
MSGSEANYTAALLELASDGVLDRDELLHDLLQWMGESQVEQFCKRALTAVTIPQA